MRNLHRVTEAKIKDLTDAQLLEEWAYWRFEVANATGWGAAPAAANKFLVQFKQEINSRNAVQVPQPRMKTEPNSRSEPNMETEPKIWCEP